MHIMKRFLLWGLTALAVVAAVESSASAYLPPGIGCRNKRVGRLEGYWFQPDHGPLYDYSSYFATMYPWLPGAQEYRWQPSAPGSFGTAMAVLPYAPPPPRPQPNANPRPGEVRIIEVRPDPNTAPRIIELKPTPPK
jgi:hypothetical protein